MICGATLWQSLNYFELVQVMRQSDERFSSILTKIGNGDRLLQDKIELIESRFRTEEWCNENLLNVVRLYYRKQH